MTGTMGVTADAQGRLWRVNVNGWRWTHLDMEHPGATQGLADEGWLSGDALDLMRDKDESPRLEYSADIAIGVIPDFLRRGGGDAQSSTCWRFAMRGDRLLTAQRIPIQSLYSAGRACQEGAGPSTPSELIDQMLAGFAAETARRAGALDTEAAEIEDELLDGAGSELVRLRVRLGRVRRDVTRLQRLMLPVERLTRAEAHEDVAGWETSSVRATARRRILSAVDDLRTVSEHGRALQDELSARQEEATTRSLSTLSILSAGLLPPSLVTGFFGMNTESLPFKDMENGTWFAASVALVSIAATLLLLRLRRVF